MVAGDNVMADRAEPWTHKQELDDVQAASSQRSVLGDIVTLPPKQKAEAV